MHAPSVKSATVLFLAFSLVHSVGADAPPVTRIEYRTISAQIVAGTFGAQPKVVYIAGEKYTRMEEAPNPAHGAQQLIVASEPDIWMINLLDHTGRHILDLEPKPVVHQKILPPSAPKFFAGLEFGKEVAFFHDQHAASLPEQTLDGQRCEVLDLNQDGAHLVLFVGADSHHPFHLDITRPGEAPYSFRYLKYETDLPFDAALFQPPAGTTITEAQPAKPAKPAKKK